MTLGEMLALFATVAALSKPPWRFWLLAACIVLPAGLGS